MPRKRGDYKPSRRYRELDGKIDKTKIYSLDDALTILKSGSKKCKFDESVELAIKLGIDPKQADQLVRGSFSLPKGTGKALRVICFAEGALAEEAKKAGAVEAGGEDLAKKVNDGWLEFDVAIAHPATMRYVGRLGKVLGPKGLMPSPKSGTVTPNVVQAVNEFKAGKLEYRNDSFGNVHVAVGKLSFSKDDLKANVEAMVNHIKAIRPAAVKGIYMEKVTVTSTMGPGLRVEA
ncbi:MAG: 50S ribosomal protein L1 [Planctomycetota bacterium]|nr:50S ribosomal protein L1 [Planctomycetota bacterium]